MWFCFLIWETWQFCPLLEHTARITWRQREELTLNHVCVFSLVYVFVLGLGWNMDVAENGLYTSLHQNSHSFKIVKGKLMTGGTMGIPFLLGPSPPWHIAQVTDGTIPVETVEKPTSAPAAGVPSVPGWRRLILNQQ